MMRHALVFLLVTGAMMSAGSRAECGQVRVELRLGPHVGFSTSYDLARVYPGEDYRVRVWLQPVDDGPMPDGAADGLVDTRLLLLRKDIDANVYAGAPVDFACWDAGSEFYQQDVVAECARVPLSRQGVKRRSSWAEAEFRVPYIEGDYYLVAATSWEVPSDKAKPMRPAIGGGLVSSLLPARMGPASAPAEQRASEFRRYIIARLEKRWSDARVHLETAIAIREESGEPVTHSHTLLAEVFEELDEPRQALEHYRTALRLCREAVAGCKWDRLGGGAEPEIRRLTEALRDE